MRKDSDLGLTEQRYLIRQPESAGAAAAVASEKGNVSLENG